MNPFIEQRFFELSKINRQVAEDPDTLIREEDERYKTLVAQITDNIDKRLENRGMLLLSGPSAAGKTTTAQKIRQGLLDRGRETHVVSLDNFYRGKGNAPQLPDGTFDYESVEALDIPQLQECMSDLVKSGRTMIPLFDFIAGKPLPEKQELTIGERSIVIFEGIHALDPHLEEHLSGRNRYKLFINAMTPVYDGDDKLLVRRDTRLIRRMIRDLRFRNSSIENTLNMWKQVVQGEKRYMLPHVDTADATFDTTHAYEAAMLGKELLPHLREAETDTAHQKTVRHLIDVLSRFTPLSVERLPKDSLLREFLGD